MTSEFRKEQLIKEQRLIEATQKNYIGATGKLGIIARFLGSPIISQGGHGGWGAESNFVDFNFWENDEDEIPTMEEVDPHDIGWVFDGLSRGFHLEIKYFDPTHALSVYYKGYKVYEEISGELMVYAPFKEWESIIEHLHKLAEKNRENEYEIEESLLKEENKLSASNLWQKLRLRWGI